MVKVHIPYKTMRRGTLHNTKEYANVYEFSCDSFEELKENFLNCSLFYEGVQDRKGGINPYFWYEEVETFEENEFPVVFE